MWKNELAHSNRVNEDGSFLEDTAKVPLVQRNADDQDGDESTLEDRVDELYEELGGCGLFQVLAYFAITFGMSAPSWFIYEIGFLTQAPTEYICTYYSATDQPACTLENICADNPAIESWEADPASVKTLYNWQ